MSMAIDVPSHEIAQRISATLKQYSLSTVLTLLRSLGKVIEKQLSQGKGVRLDKFGSFIYSAATNLPTFQLSSDFIAAYGVRQKGVPSEKDTASMVAKLNYLQLAKYSNVDREAAEKVYKKLVEVLGRIVQEGKSTLLNFKIVDLYFANKDLTCTFYPPYASDGGSNNNYNNNGKQRSVTDMMLQAQSTLKKGLSQLTLANSSTPYGDPKAPENAGVYRKRSSSLSTTGRIPAATRDRNPITGERDGGEESRRPTSGVPPQASRNPFLQS